MTRPPAHCLDMLLESRAVVESLKHGVAVASVAGVVQAKILFVSRKNRAQATIQARRRTPLHGETKSTPLPYVYVYNGFWIERALLWIRKPYILGVYFRWVAVGLASGYVSRRRWARVVVK